MIRWLGLWRLVYGRARSDWPFLLAVWLLIVSATTLLASGSLYAETVEAGGLRRALAEAAPEQRGVSVSLSAAPAEVGELDAGVRRALDDAFRGAGAELALTARSSTLRRAASESRTDQLILLGAYERLREHAELTEGRWPEAGQQPVEAAVHEAAAEALGVRPGDRLALADAARPGADPSLVVFELEISGLYRADAEGAYWLGDRLEIDGVAQTGSQVYVGPLMVEADDLLGSEAFSRLDLTWRALPRVERLRVDLLEQTRARINGLPRAVEQALPAGRFVTVNRELANVLGRLDRSALVSRSGVVLVTLQFGILAAYAVLLVGAILAERRRPEVALLRARGASTADVGLVAAGEALLLSLPAVLVAPWLALGLVEAVGRWGAVGESGIIAGAAISQLTLAVALLSGLACLIALTLPALLAEVDLARVRAALGRPLAQTAAQRLGLDIILLVLAVIGIIQLRAYGGTLTETTGGRVEIDPLLVAAPAIALAAGAVLVVRLVPRLGELAEWLVSRGRGILLPVSARQLARRPLRYTRSAMLLVLAATLSTFGAIYFATWSQSQSEQASYQAGADVRAIMPPHTRATAEEIRAELTALPGVQEVSPLIRGQAGVGRAVRQADMLAVEPEVLSDMADFPAASDLATRASLAELAAARPPDVAIDLPADARRLAVMLEAEVQPLVHDPHYGSIDDWPGITVAPIIDTGGSTAMRMTPVPAQFSGVQRLAFELPQTDGVGARSANRLLAIELQLHTPVEATGHVSLLQIETSLAEAGEDWSPLADMESVAGWSLVHHLARGRGAVDLRGATITGDEQSPLEPCQAWTVIGCAVEEADYRWAPLRVSEPLAAIASEQFLRQSGTSVGQTLSVDFLQSLELRIIGSLEMFPSLDPGRPFLIVDASSLNQRRFDAVLSPAHPTEWWIAAEDEAVPTIVEAAGRPPVAAREVVTRAELTRTLQRDPIALGLVGALLLGSLAAAGFAVLGLLVGAIVSAREQLGELALLRALGVSTRQVIAWLSIEHSFLLALGVTAGAGLGALIAVLVLPHAPLNRTGAQVVPAPQITLPLELLGLVLVGALTLVVSGVLLAQREVRARSVVDVLRERED